MFDYDAFYKTQGADFLNDSERHSFTSKLCRGKVADIGCCMGILSDYYFGDYTGFDFSKPALEKAKDVRRKDARFIFRDCSDLSALDIENYDTFVLAEFLEHFENDEKILDPIFARAKQGARIIINVPNGDRIPDPSHLRTLTIPELRKRFAPHGKVKFYNWPGGYMRIMMTCDLGQKNDDLISLVIPAKNEEKGLESAVLSCIEFVDNVVISVDSASTDKTLEVAKRYADVVKTYNWKNSFAKARNFAQEGVKTKWILALDGHEFVDSFSDLDKFLAEDVEGIEVDVVLENGFKFHFPRLIRSFVKWSGDVHNFPVIKSRKFYKDFLIRHDREHLQAKESAAIRDKQRIEMVRSIMHEELKKNKKNARPHFYLGQQYFIQKDFKKSIKHYKKYLKFSKHRGERWLVCLYISHAHTQLGHYLRALWALRDAEKETPGRWEIQKIRGAIFAMSGKHEEAVKSFVESFTQQTGNFSYYPEKRNDAQTWDFIGHCLFKLKNYHESKIAWNRFLKLEKEKPEKEQNKTEIQLIESMLKT